MTMERRRVGLAGERAALHYLKQKGYAVDQVNYRCPLGEIDIVAREGQTVVFVEVRARTGPTMGTPAESITAAKGKKLKRLAQYYLQSVYGRETSCRFDLVGVHLDKSSLAVRKIEHLREIRFG